MAARRRPRPSRIGGASGRLMSSQLQPKSQRGLIDARARCGSLAFPANLARARFLVGDDHEHRPRDLASPCWHATSLCCLRELSVRHGNLTVPAPVRELGPDVAIQVVKDRPSTDKNVMRPLPDDGLRRGCRPSARSCHRPRSFRPCRSSRLRRFSPHRRPAGLLHPAAGHGVRHVSSFVLHSAETKLQTTLSPVTPHPSEPFPRPQPYRVATASYLLAVPTGLGTRCGAKARHSRRWGPPADLKVFLRSRIRCMHLDVAAELQLDAPLGFVPKEVPDRQVLRSEERRWMRRGRHAFRCLRARRGHVSSVPPGGASESIKVCWSFSRPLFDDRATLRCDVPLRVALRCTVSRRAEAHPVTETVQQVPSGRLPGADSATGSAFLLDFDHLAKCGRVQSTVPQRRSALVPDIPLMRDAAGFRDSVGGTAPQIPRPLGQARESAFVTVRNVSGLTSSTSVPAVGFALLSARAHQDSHSPSGALKSASLEPRSSEHDTRLDWRGALWRRPSGHCRPVHPVPATPKRRGSRAPRLAV